MLKDYFRAVTTQCLPYEFLYNFIVYHSTTAQNNPLIFFSG
jgi:hypothetical protein